MVREGNRSLIVQWCSNTLGHFMKIVEYGGGSRRNFIFIPEDMKGKRWRMMMEVLWEFTNEVRGRRHNTGGAPLKPLVVVLQSQNCSYREALELVQTHENRGGGRGDVKA